MREPLDIFNELVSVIEAQALERIVGKIKGEVRAKKPKPRPFVAKTKPAAAKPAPAAPQKNKMRTPAEIAKLTADMIGFIKRAPAPGPTTREMAEFLKVTPIDLRFPLRKLREEKILSSKGKSHAMRYQVKD